MTPDQGSSAEKTEKATPKKREDARKKGQVLKSAEVNTAVVTVSMFLVLFLFAGWLSGRLMTLLTYYLGGTGWGPAEVTDKALHSEFFNAIYNLVLSLLPFLAVSFLAGILVNVAQIGLLFTGEPLKPKFSKINPISGFQRIFSMKTFVELLKTIAKVVAVGVVVYLEYMKNLNLFPMMLELEPAQAGKALFDMCMAVAIKASMVLVAIGLVDYLYQWYDYEKNLRMTKEEIKQEFKQMEGDPQIKSKRKEIARKLSMMRMMQAIPQADVVITNPTHYAIAVKYDAKEADAPIVLAKGKDMVAQRIKETAREHKIEIVENKPVAQALYVACEVGQKIPSSLFAAVAEILAHVYSLKNPKPPPKPGRRPVRTASGGSARR